MQQEAISTALFDPIARRTIEWKIHWLFRLALFCEFVGHGAFGVLTKAGWVRYFGIFGIPDAWAWKLMPVVGSVDIALGILTLLAPRKALLLYMSFWSLFTALLRPLSGEGWWEFFERSYNFGVPLLMLWVHGPGTNVASWLAVITTVPRFASASAQKYQWALQVIMASMLIGHGGFGLVMGKPNLVNFYSAAGFGVFDVPLPTFSAWIGGFEILLGVLCLGARFSAFFLFVCIWKLGTELLYVPAQAYGAWWEVIERGSSYAAPLLWIGFQQLVHRTVPPLTAATVDPRRRTGHRPPVEAEDGDEDGQAGVDGDPGVVLDEYHVGPQIPAPTGDRRLPAQPQAAQRHFYNDCRGRLKGPQSAPLSAACHGSADTLSRWCAAPPLQDCQALLGHAGAEPPHTPHRGVLRSAAHQVGIFPARLRALWLLPWHAVRTTTTPGHGWETRSCLRRQVACPYTPGSPHQSGLRHGAQRIPLDR